LVAPVDTVAKALAIYEGAVPEERHKQLALRLLKSPDGPLAGEQGKKEFDPRSMIG
jgi:hypothetical protein